MKIQNPKESNAGEFLAPRGLLPNLGAQLKPSGIALMMALTQHAWDQGDEPVSHATLAKMIGTSVTTVKLTIKRLERLHLIKSEYRGNGKACRYRVLWVERQEERRERAAWEQELVEMREQREELLAFATAAPHLMPGRIEEQLQQDTVAMELELQDRLAEYEAASYERAFGRPLAMAG